MTTVDGGAKHNECSYVLSCPPIYIYSHLDMVVVPYRYTFLSFFEADNPLPLILSTVVCFFFFSCASTSQSILFLAAFPVLFSSWPSPPSVAVSPSRNQTHCSKPFMITVSVPSSFHFGPAVDTLLLPVFIVTMAAMLYYIATLRHSTTTPIRIPTILHFCAFLWFIIFFPLFTLASTFGAFRVDLCVCVRLCMGRCSFRCCYDCCRMQDITL